MAASSASAIEPAEFTTNSRETGPESGNFKHLGLQAAGSIPAASTI
jgi:hypothetical protein